jgi:hypothetical protein
MTRPSLRLTLMYEVGGQAVELLHFRYLAYSI